MRWKILPENSDNDEEKEDASVWYTELEQERAIVGFVLIADNPCLTKANFHESQLDTSH